MTQFDNSLSQKSNKVAVRDFKFEIEENYSKKKEFDEHAEQTNVKLENLISESQIQKQMLELLSKEQRSRIYNEV